MMKQSGPNKDSPPDLQKEICCCEAVMGGLRILLCIRGAVRAEYEVSNGPTDRLVEWLCKSSSTSVMKRVAPMVIFGLRYAVA